MVGLHELDAEPTNAKISHYIENISQTDTFIIVGFYFTYYLFGSIN